MAGDEKSQFDWDAHNIAHVAKHKVTPAEVEQVLANDPLLIETQIDPKSGEERILELGHTDAGRVLFVTWTPRERLRAPGNRLPGKQENPRRLLQEENR